MLIQPYGNSQPIQKIRKAAKLRILWRLACGYAINLGMIQAKEKDIPCCFYIATYVSAQRATCQRQNLRECQENLKNYAGSCFQFGGSSDSA